MLTPVRCISCGSPLGCKAALFRALRLARARKALEASGVLPSQASLRAAGLRLDMSDILSRLGVDLNCCRMHMVTAMDWRDYY